MPMTEDQATAAARELLKVRRNDREYLDTARRYWTGKQRLPQVVPDGAPREVYEMARMARVNVCDIVVESLAQSLFAEGFRIPREADNLRVWDAWQANKMDARQDGIHRATVAYGVAYAVVLPGRDRATGRPMPRIRGVSPRRMTTLYEFDDDWPTRALENRDALGKQWRLYDSDAVYTLARTGDGKGDDAEFELIQTTPHPFRVVPVVRYKDTWDLDSDDEPEDDRQMRLGAGRPQLVGGQVGKLQPLQDQIDFTTFNLLVAQHYAAFKQRYVIGWTAGSENEQMKAAASRLWTFEDAPEDVAVGEFGETSLDGYIKSREASLRHAATLSQTPVHELIGELVNLPLALDTVVPVPGGRTTMGELQVGDTVFAPDGSTVDVVGVSPTYEGRTCYRLTFDDGSQVVADARHPWQTSRFKTEPYLNNPYDNGRETAIVSTEEIAQTLKTCMGTSNHFIPVASPHDGPAQEYPIDPYVLGVYLGDGDRCNGVITQHADDAGELADLLEDCGETVRSMPYPQGDKTRVKLVMAHDFTRCPYGHTRPRGTHTEHHHCGECGKLRYRLKAYGEPMPARVNESFQKRLEAVGVRHDKHIPESYFHGSFKQRLALLQGIMDTDGSPTKQGTVAITQHNERMATDIHRLAMSLGHKVALKRGTWANAWGSGSCWRMTWGALDPVFRLERKASRQRTDFGGGDGGSNRPLRRYIVGCEQVDSVPVRCIRVSSEQHLFCVTDGFISTHNSAEALAAAEAGRDRKVDDRKTLFGESHEQTLYLVGRLMGLDVPANAQMVWRDTSARALGAVVDALGKMAQMLEIPPVELWERIPGVTMSDVERFKEAKENEPDPEPQPPEGPPSPPPAERVPALT